MLCSPALLTIDLAAIQHNYRILCSKTSPAVECGAVVKANAYGLGATQVVVALYHAGARTFFVAHLSEALELLPLNLDADFYVLNGLLPGEEAEYYHKSIRPILNDMDQIERWVSFGRTQDKGVKPAALHIDTGMSRLGLDAKGLSKLINAPDLLKQVPDLLIMSHLLSADNLSHPRNRQQLDHFRQILSQLPKTKYSLANSSGIFIDAGFHFDLLRPGFALYGGNPTPKAPNPMQSVVKLEATVLSAREIQPRDTVSYGAAWTAERPSRLVTLGLGYADGFFRSQSNQGKVLINGTLLPVVGKVTMDMIVVDVTDLPDKPLQVGHKVTILDQTFGIDQMAQLAGTIGYEVLTNLGHRYPRHYVGKPIHLRGNP